MLECTFQDLNLPAPSLQANEDIFEILGISVDALDEHTEIPVSTKEEDDKYDKSLSPDHNMEAPATDSEKLLFSVRGSRKRKRDISYHNCQSYIAAKVILCLFFLNI